MPWWGICLIIFVTFITFAILHFLGKNKHPFKRSLLSMTLGAATLFAVNLTGAFTGVTLPISLLSLLVSIIGGIPGVTLMLGLILKKNFLDNPKKAYKIMLALLTKDKETVGEALEELYGIV